MQLSNTDQNVDPSSSQKAGGDSPVIENKTRQPPERKVSALKTPTFGKVQSTKKTRLQRHAISLKLTGKESFATSSYWIMRASWWLIKWERRDNWASESTGKTRPQRSWTLPWSASSLCNHPFVFDIIFCPVTKSLRNLHGFTHWLGELIGSSEEVGRAKAPDVVLWWLVIAISEEKCSWYKLEVESEWIASFELLSCLTFPLFCSNLIWHFGTHHGINCLIDTSFVL